MSPWTALLESLHSALIDELTERHPEPKPELGLPIRKSAYEGAPLSECDRVLASLASFEDNPHGSLGIAMIALSPQARKKLSIDEPKLWDALLKRAGSEFLHRKIRPKLAPPQSLDAKAGLPKGFPNPQRVIWIPFKLDGAPLLLGLGA